MPEDVVWSIEAVRALGATTDIERAAAALGIGRTKAYELAKEGQFPAKTIRIGRRYRVSVPAILRLLEADVEPFAVALFLGGQAGAGFGEGGQDGEGLAAALAEFAAEVGMLRTGHRGRTFWVPRAWRPPRRSGVAAGQGRGPASGPRGRRRGSARGVDGRLAA